MTGLASDIDYVTSVVQKQVDDHRKIFDGASSAKTYVQSTSDIVQILSDILQRETRYDGQRPLGIQVLLVGRDPKAYTNQLHRTAHAFKIFTLDPSGGYRHWGGGAAIGRNAAFVRKQLQEQSSSMDAGRVKGISALQLCLRSSMKARREESTKGGELSDEYEALLLWEENENFCVASIDPKQINDMRMELQAELDDSENGVST